MIKIYTSPSCSSCRKVKKWFKEQNIPFIEKNIFSPSLTINDLKEIISKSENGTDDIISERSKIMKGSHKNLEDMKMSELLEFIKENPSILKRPIIVDDSRIQVGYNEDEIGAFIPIARRIALLNCTREACSKYDSCPHIKDREDN